MKVGFVLDGDLDHPGGVQSYVKGLYKFLVQSGYEAVVFSGGKRGKSEGQGYEVVRMGKIQKFLGNDASISVYTDWVESKDVKRLIKREKADILHLQGFFGLLGARFITSSPVPTVGSFHNFWEEERFPFLLKLVSPLARYYINKLDVRIADSPAALEFAQGIAPGDYKVIPPGIDVSYFQKASPKRVFPKDWVEILFLGRLDERKGIMHLLRSFSILNKQFAQVGLAIGGEGPQKSKAYNFVKEMGLGAKVKFLGFVPEDRLPSFYKGADVFCSPATHGESFGIVLLEAMAAGLPVVAFDNPGYRNVLKGEGKRFLVENGDVQALSEALGELVGDESLRRKMANWSKSEVRKYDWRRVGEEVVEVYNSLL